MPNEKLSQKSHKVPSTPHHQSFHKRMLALFHSVGKISDPLRWKEKIRQGETVRNKNDIDVITLSRRKQGKIIILATVKRFDCWPLSVIKLIIRFNALTGGEPQFLWNKPLTTKTKIFCTAYDYVGGADHQNTKSYAMSQAVIKDYWSTAHSSP